MNCIIEIGKKSYFTPIVSFNSLYNPSNPHETSNQFAIRMNQNVLTGSLAKELSNTMQLAMQDELFKRKNQYFSLDSEWEISPEGPSIATITVSGNDHVAVFQNCKLLKTDFANFSDETKSVLDMCWEFYTMQQLSL